jgi:NAD(P)-dependent dehydrogenase (short-subunit alcohol dehydrogenase family)
MREIRYLQRHGEMNMSTKYALVTGASTGIGHACACALAERGYRVFAGVRTEADAERIRAEGGGEIEPVTLDVTDPGQIAAAARHVSAACGDAGLHGLVNNAGIAVAGPLEFIPMEDFARQMAVNVNGLLAVTQAFLPLLRRAAGRLCLISSTKGVFSPPFMGPCSAAKFAVEALGDALRVELAPWKIRVSLVQPGAIQTPIWDKSKAANEALLARMPAACTELYGGAMEIMRREAEKMAGRAAPVRRVSDCVVHALTSKRPKTRYLCGGGARMDYIAGRWIPDGLRDRLIRAATGLGG